MNNILRLLYIFTLIVFPTNAFAYLDPGTGSIILQAILGFIASIVVGASFYWHKFKLFIKKIFKKDKNERP